MLFIECFFYRNNHAARGLNPFDYRFYTNEALAHKKLDNIEEALKCAQAALEINPSLPKVLHADSGVTIQRFTLCFCFE